MKKTILALSLLFAGCTTHIAGNLNPRSPEKLPQEITTAVDITNENSIVTFVNNNQVEDDTLAVYLVGDQDNTPLLKFRYLKSTVEITGKRDLIVIYNILKDKHQIVAGLMADALMNKGFDCIIVNQEFFLEKPSRWVRPIVSDSKSPFRFDSDKLGYDDYNIHLARGVKHIIERWVPLNKRLSGRYGFVGVSMGGMHAIGAAALFPDSVMTVAIMAGGDNVELFKTSEEKLLVDNREALFDLYAAKLTKLHPDVRVDWEQRVYDDIGKLKFQILELAKTVQTGRVKLMITLNDVSVPTATQWRLFVALGGPEARLFPCGHYSMALYYFSIKWQLQEWMTRAFAR